MMQDMQSAYRPYHLLYVTYIAQTRPTNNNLTLEIRQRIHYSIPSDIVILMYKTAVYTLVNGAITHQKPQI